MEIKTILVPVDFTASSDAAATVSVEIAHVFHSQIKFLHVYPIPVLDPNMPVEMVEQMIHDNEKKATDHFENLKKTLPPAADLQIDFLIKPGFTVSEILMESENIQPDLLIIGNSGHEGFIKMMGSNSSSIIQKANIPVLVVPENHDYQGIRQVLCGLDLLEHDYTYIEKTLNFTEAFNSDLNCIHIRKENENINEPLFNKLKDKYQSGTNRQVHFTIIDAKNIEEGIDTELSKQQYDLLVLLTRKRNLLERLFHKSITSSVASHSTIPILVFHQ
jgi:nucleotide-binding universal stress UspA family protein